MVNFSLSGPSGVKMTPKQFYKKRKKTLTSEEIAESLTCSDTENMGEYDDNEIDDIGDPEIPGNGRTLYLTMTVYSVCACVISYIHDDYIYIYITPY